MSSQRWLPDRRLFHKVLLAIAVLLAAMAGATWVARVTMFELSTAMRTMTLAAGERLDAVLSVRAAIAGAMDAEAGAVAAGSREEVDAAYRVFRANIDQVLDAVALLALDGGGSAADAPVSLGATIEEYARVSQQAFDLARAFDTGAALRLSVDVGLPVRRSLDAATAEAVRGSVHAMERAGGAAAALMPDALRRLYVVSGAGVFAALGLAAFVAAVHVARPEPRRDSRRPFGLSHAAMATSSVWA